MRRKTLRNLLAITIDDHFPDMPKSEPIAVVEIADYRQVKERDERQLLTIATLEAERAQLRMLLKEALGQLERIFTTTKVASPEYRRLMARSDAVLAPKAVEP